MSTKAIREALGRLEMLMEEPPAGMSVEDAVLLNSARTEVEAIERAAHEVVREKALEDWNTAQPVALREGIKVIQAIAKQEP